MSEDEHNLAAAGTPESTPARLYRAEACLPAADSGRARQVLRQKLRLLAISAGEAPDWDTFAASESTSDLDDHGRTWWTWSATVQGFTRP